MEKRFKIYWLILLALGIFDGLDEGIEKNKWNKKFFGTDHNRLQIHTLRPLTCLRALHPLNGHIMFKLVYSYDDIHQAISVSCGVEMGWKKFFCC